MNGNLGQNQPHQESNSMLGEMRQGSLLRWTNEESSNFGVKPVHAKHRLHDLSLFTDGALIELLDGYPRERLQSFTMGSDFGNQKDWKPVDTAGITGKEMFEAASKGRLWFNIHQVNLVDSRFAELVNQLYSELCQQCQGFKPVKKSATLIISSPNALVYYHTDAQPNLLWQIRGSKKVWVYPAEDRTIMSQELMEDIFSSFADEEVPYQAEFDKKAVVYNVNPGDVLSWPQNSPHRVSNQPMLNVSLSTVHQTEESDRRKLIYCANRFLRKTFHIPTYSTQEKGVVPYVKRLAFRTCRKMGLVYVPPRRGYITNLTINPSAPNGIQVVPSGPILTEYSQKDFDLGTDVNGEIVTVPKEKCTRG